MMLPGAKCLREGRLAKPLPAWQASPEVFLLPQAPQPDCPLREPQRRLAEEHSWDSQS